MKKTVFSFLLILAFWAVKAQDVPQSKPVVKSVIYVPQALPPSSPTIGEKYLSTNGNYYRWDGSAWIVDVEGGTPTTDASLLTSGVLADGRVQQSNVTQHEAALSINKSQIPDFGSYINILALVDDDTFGSATATNVPSAESVKAYVDNNSGSLSPTDQAKLDNLTVSNPYDLDSWSFEIAGISLREFLSNKATNLDSPDNTKYPSTLAVSNALAGLVTELTQAEFDALTTSEKLNLGLYVITPPAPSGYTVAIDNDPVLANGSDSFTFAGAEVGAYYDYSFTSDGGGTPVTGFGTISTATDQITDVDLSSLSDGTITLTVYLSNIGGQGADATDTAIKGSAITDLYVTGDAASAGAGEANDVSQWTPNGSSCVITSVANTDGGGGGSYAVNLEQLNAGFRSGAISVTGLNLTPHTATFRTRRVSGTGGVFNWQNVTGATYNVDYDANGTNWFEATVTFTPTSSTVTMQFYPGDNDGTATGAIEISEIVITEN
jgi:hypothetical protein